MKKYWTEFVDYTYQDAVLDSKDDSGQDFSWSAIQYYLCWWGRKIWKGGKDLDLSVPNSLHLLEEAQELINAIEAYKKNPTNRKLFDDVRYELADIVGFAYDIAGDFGINLTTAILEKMEINKKRKWHEPDENGMIRHIEEPDPSLSVPIVACGRVTSNFSVTNASKDGIEKTLTGIKIPNLNNWLWFHDNDMKSDGNVFIGTNGFISVDEGFKHVPYLEIDRSLIQGTVRSFFFF